MGGPGRQIFLNAADFVQMEVYHFSDSSDVTSHGRNGVENDDQMSYSQRNQYDQSQCNAW